MIQIFIIDAKLNAISKLHIDINYLIIFPQYIITCISYDLCMDETNIWVNKRVRSANNQEQSFLKRKII